MLYVLIILLLSGEVVAIEQDGGEEGCRYLGELAVAAGAVEYRCVQRFDV